MSDIVTCRLWMPVAVKEFYNPVLTFLEDISDDPDALPSFTGMRTISEIRREQQIPIPLNKDSLYKPVTRVRKEFSKILVPKKLQEVSSYAKCACTPFDIGVLGSSIFFQAEAARVQEQEVLHCAESSCAGAR